MSLSDVKVIAWDFDGVLNRNIEDGVFIWSRDFERDLGLPLQSFHTFLFKGRFQQAMRGDADLKAMLSDWLSLHDTAHSAQDILDYWFNKDALPDANMLGYIQQLSTRNLTNIIATNNEIHRAEFIEDRMGFGGLVDHLFAAGRMRTAKPDLSYFRHIEAALNLPSRAFLLVDDMAENIEAAQLAGWQAHHHRECAYRDLEQLLGLQPYQ